MADNAVPSTFTIEKAAGPTQGQQSLRTTRDALPYGLVRLSTIVPPVTLDELKYQTRIELSETYEDSLLTLLLSDATEYVQKQSDTAIEGSASWRLTTPRFPVECTMYLPRPPLVSVTSVKYYDDDGNDIAFGDFYPDLDNSRLVLNQGHAWPFITQCRSDAVRVTYTAGAATVSGLARRAVLLLASHWYFAREDSTEKKLSMIPHGVDSLIEAMRPGDYFTFPDR